MWPQSFRLMMTSTILLSFGLSNLLARRALPIRPLGLVLTPLAILRRAHAPLPLLQRGGELLPGLGVLAGGVLAPQRDQLWLRGATLRGRPPPGLPRSSR